MRQLKQLRGFQGSCPKPQPLTASGRRQRGPSHASTEAVGNPPSPRNGHAGPCPPGGSWRLVQPCSPEQAAPASPGIGAGEANPTPPVRAAPRAPAHAHPEGHRLGTCSSGSLSSVAPRCPLDSPARSCTRAALLGPPTHCTCLSPQDTGTCCGSRYQASGSHSACGWASALRCKVQDADWAPSRALCSLSPLSSLSVLLWPVGWAAGLCAP